MNGASRSAARRRALTRNPTETTSPANCAGSLAGTGVGQVIGQSWPTPREHPGPPLHPPGRPRRGRALVELPAHRHCRSAMLNWTTRGGGGGDASNTCRLNTRSTGAVPPAQSRNQNKPAARPVTSIGIRNLAPVATRRPRLAYRACGVDPRRPARRRLRPGPPVRGRRRTAAVTSRIFRSNRRRNSATSPRGCSTERVTLGERDLKPLDHRSLLKTRVRQRFPRRLLRIDRHDRSTTITLRSHPR